MPISCLVALPTTSLTVAMASALPGAGDAMAMPTAPMVLMKQDAVSSAHYSNPLSIPLQS